MRFFYLLIPFFILFSCDKPRDSQGEEDGSQAYSYDGERLLISTKFPGDSQYDLHQEWQYCLQGSLNTIFSFFRISKVSNSSRTPKLRTLGKKQTVIMTQSSDCILAARINDSKDFTGRSEYCSGNHAFVFNDSYYKTAETTSVNIFADGVKLQKGESGYAQEIVVEVVSFIYDPFVLRNSLLINLYNPEYHKIIEERITYVIRRGGILCDVVRQYTDMVNMEAYGGFASMAMSLNYAFFPCGAEMMNASSDSFGELMSNIGFNHECDKKQYPDFDHFVRRNEEGTIYETVYLLGAGSGNHAEIPDDYSMYWVYNAKGATEKKVYHRVTYHKIFSPGEQQCIKCLYTWHIPQANTKEYLISQAGDYIFVDLKGPFSGIISVPELFSDSSYRIYKVTAGVIEAKANYQDGSIFVSSEKKSSIILMR